MVYSSVPHENNRKTRHRIAYGLVFLFFFIFSKNLSYNDSTALYAMLRINTAAALLSQ